MTSNDDIDAAVGAAFGRPAPSVVESAAGVARDAFLDAGFCEADADRGVQLLESGDYLGFEDVAVSMGCFDSAFRGRNPRVTTTRIRETAVKYKDHRALHEAAPGGRAAADSQRIPARTFIDGVPQ